MGLVITTSVHLFCGLVLVVSRVTVFKCDKAFTFWLRAFSSFTQSRIVSTWKLLSVDSVTHMTFIFGMWQKPFDQVLSI